jgi:hypothetical protein
MSPLARASYRYIVRLARAALLTWVAATLTMLLAPTMVIRVVRAPIDIRVASPGCYCSTSRLPWRR